MTLGLFVSDGGRMADKFLFTFAALLIGLVALIGGFIIGLKSRESWLMFFKGDGVQRICF